MISFLELEDKIKKNKIDNCYIMCGFNEQLIKEYIDNIVKNCLDEAFKTFNYVQFDGNTALSETIRNACETLPFMGEKKVVVIYRADFLLDKGKATNRDGAEILSFLDEYLANMPKHCILILYYVFEGDRERVSKKALKLDKKASVVEFLKLKGNALSTKVKAMFDARNKNIGKVELSIFCNEVENNLNIIENEVEKLCCYSEGREITKADIFIMLPEKNNMDIFNLVDFISQKKPEKALDALDELLFRGEKPTSVLSMIERQFKLMLNIKIGMENGKNKTMLSSELRLNPYICEKMMSQCTRFSLKQLKASLEICLNTERELKSFSTEGKIQMELLIVNTARV